MLYGIKSFKMEAVAQKHDLRLIRDNTSNESSNFSFMRNDRLVIKQSSLYKIIPFSEIIYLMSDSNYTWIYTKDGGAVMASRTLKTFTSQLSNSFLRVHQSYCINLLFLREYQRNNNQIKLVDNSLIPVSRSKKKDLEACFKSEMI